MSSQNTILEEGQFGIKAHSEYETPVQTRNERFTSVDVKDFPPVNGREVYFKYSPVQEFADLANNELNGSRYELTYPEDGLTVTWVPRDFDLIGKAGTPEDKVSANAWTHFEEALHVKVTATDGREIVIVREKFGPEARAAHMIIEFEPQSKAHLIIDNRGEANLAENIEIQVGAGADVSVLSLQNWSEEAHYLAQEFCIIGRDANLKHLMMSFGGKIVRVNPTAWLNSQGGNAELYGLYFADAHQHLEHQVFINHDAPFTRSRVNYRGALQGDGAHTVWIGDVLIGRNGTATDTYEENRNLMLTPGTRADSIPNLEIETGDIAGAGHASATGRFDEEQLFYLMSRGLTEVEARRQVILGFLTTIVQQIPSETYQEFMGQILEAEVLVMN